MKNLIRKSMIALLIFAVLVPSQAMAKDSAYDVDTSDYTLAVVGAGLALGALIWWGVRAARKKSDTKSPKLNLNQTAATKKPKVSLMLDVLNDPLSRTAATNLNLEPTYVIGAKIRF